MKRSLIISAGLAVVALAGGSTLLAQKAQQAEANWRADIKTRGIQVEMASPLQWQLWPLGLKGTDLILKAEQGSLLSSPSVFLGLGPSDLFSQKAGVLHLQDAVFHYQKNTDGSSNWDTFLKGSGPSPLRGLRLENATLEISTENSAPDLTVSIPQLQWTNAGTDGHPLQADFLISSQDEQQNNLLVESSLQTTVLPQGEKEWQLKATTLNTTVSSTRLPGTLVFKSSGDIQLQAHELRSEDLKVHGAFKAPGQTQDVAADMAATLQLDWQAGKMHLPALSIKVGSNDWQLKGDMAASWVDKSLQAKQLSLIRKVDTTPTAQQLDINDLSLSAKAEGDHQQFNLSGKVGKGSFDIPVRAKLTVDSAHIAATLNASNIDLKSLRSWMNDSEASGLLTLSATIETAGHSLTELQEKAAGQLSLNLDNAQLSAVSVIPALRERLQGYASLLPALAENKAPEKGTRIRELQLQASLSGGVITTKKLHADIDLARLDASGSYNSRNGLMDYRGKLALDRRLFIAQNSLELPIICQGNLHEEQVDFVGGLETDCKVDEQAKQDLLARALINRFRN